MSIYLDPVFWLFWLALALAAAVTVGPWLRRLDHQRAQAVAARFEFAAHQLPEVRLRELAGEYADELLDAADGDPRLALEIAARLSISQYVQYHGAPCPPGMHTAVAKAARDTRTLIGR